MWAPLSAGVVRSAQPALAAAQLGCLRLISTFGKPLSPPRQPRRAQPASPASHRSLLARPHAGPALGPAGPPPLGGNPLPFLPSLEQFEQVDVLADEIMDGQRAAISHGITLAESTRPDHQLQAARLLRELHKRMVAERRLLMPPHVAAAGGFAGSGATAGGAGASASPGRPSSEDHGANSSSNNNNFHHRTTAFRVGFSGPPGAGKSSLIETLGTALVEAGDKVGGWAPPALCWARRWWEVRQGAVDAGVEKDGCRWRPGTRWCR